MSLNLQCQKMRLLLQYACGIITNFVTFHEIIRETAAAQTSAAVFFKTVKQWKNSISFNSPGNWHPPVPSFRNK